MKLDTNTKRVIWTEGQLLTQQHLQWHEHWCAMQSTQRWQATQPKAFGWLTLVWDQQALYQQRLALTQFQVIFPDGAYYEYTAEQGVASVFIDLNTLQSPATLYLCLPKQHSVSGIPGYPEVGSRAQWTAHCQLMTDRLDAECSHELLIGRPNWQLSAEPLADCYVLPALRCELDQFSGQWRVDRHFFYPVLSLGACAALKTKTDSLLHHIEQYVYERAQTLEHHQKAWISATLYELHHGCMQQHALETIYCSLAQLLIYIAFPIKPAVGSYNPYEFHKSWQTLFAAWDQYLQQPAQQWNACLPLQQQSKIRWQLDSIMPDALDRSVWILVVESNYPLGEQLSKRFREETKIASKSQVDRLASLALNGLSLQSLLRPDPTFYQKYKGDYFQILQEGPVWENIRKEKSLGILLSAPFQDVSLKLLVAHQNEVAV